MISYIDISHFVIIQSLPDHEVQTGTELHDDIVSRRVWQSGLGSILIDVSSRVEFEIQFDLIAQKTSEGARPYIHFEIHGSETGIALKNGDLITWTEVCDLLRIINIKCVNTLVVSMATCFGAHVLRGYEFQMQAPMFAYIGPPGEILIDELRNDWPNYFDILLTGKSMVDAFNALNSGMKKSSYYIYHSTEYLFDFATNRQLQNYKDRSFRKAKIKELQKRAVSDPIIRTTKSKKEIKEHFVKHVSDMPNFIKEYRDFFLMKSPHPMIAEFIRINGIV